MTVNYPESNIAIHESVHTVNWKYSPRYKSKHIQFTVATSITSSLWKLILSTNNLCCLTRPIEKEFYNTAQLFRLEKMSIAVSKLNRMSEINSLTMKIKKQNSRRRLRFTVLENT